MTKPITSVALMSLFEKGRFELDDAAHRWIPALKNLKVYRSEEHYEPIETQITIRQLLTHTAGFTYGFDPENQPVDRLYSKIRNASKQDTSLSELIEMALEFPLIAQPGSLWHYSIATDICGYLVELMSDMPFGDYLHKTILAPLNMVDTAFEVAGKKRNRFASLYGIQGDEPLVEIESSRDSAFIPAPNMDRVKLQSGGGGLVSTVNDYWQFAQMILNRGELNGIRILQENTVREMTRNHLPEHLMPPSFNGLFSTATDGYGFGLGYCISLQDNNLGSAGDFGWGGLADTYCWIDPKNELVGILMQQFMPSLTHSGRRDFREAVYSALR